MQARNHQPAMEKMPCAKLKSPMEFPSAIMTYGIKNIQITTCEASDTDLLGEKEDTSVQIYVCEGNPTAL